MIFGKDDPIDDTLISLVKNIKRIIKRNPKISRIESRDAWLLTIEDWASETVYVLYSWLDKTPFCIYIRSEKEEYEDGEDPVTSDVIGHFSSIIKVTNSLQMLYFMDNNISEDVIKYLASKTISVPMQVAVDSMMRETDISISELEMKILNMSREKRGIVKARRFGI